MQQREITLEMAKDEDKKNEKKKKHKIDREQEILIVTRIVHGLTEKPEQRLGYYILELSSMRRALATLLNIFINLTEIFLHAFTSK